MEMIHNKWFVGYPFSQEWLNTYVSHVKQRYKEYIEKREYLSAIFSIERPYRAQELCLLLPEMTAEQQWEAIRDIYIDSENPSINYDFWRLCFTLDNLKYFYDDSKKDLPDTFKIYRGMSQKEHESKIKGFSWTLSKERAEFFAHRFKQNGVVEEREVNKKDIVCYIPDRNEEEIIYFCQD